MAYTTLQEILDNTITTLTAIIDGTTDANELYMAEKVTACFKYIAEGAFPDDHAWLGNNTGAPFYDNIQTMLSAIGAGSGVGTTVDLIVHYYKELTLGNRTITASRSNTLIVADDSREFQINVDIDPISTAISNMKFKNLTIEFANTSKVLNCDFENCILKAGNGNISLENSLLTRCFADEIDTLSLLGGNTIEFSKLKTTVNFTIPGGVDKMYGCYYTTIPTNEGYNATQDVNFHISNL